MPKLTPSDDIDDFDLDNLYLIMNYIKEHYKINIPNRTDLVEKILLENRLLNFSEIIEDENDAYIIYKLLRHVEWTCKNGTILNFAAMINITIDQRWNIEKKAIKLIIDFFRSKN
jgi:hypothetical protein